MATNNIKNNLLKLGFSSNDADIYLKLIELGGTTSGPLITATGLHRNIVYTSLEHLVSKKLVDQKLVRGVKQFSAVGPEALIEDFSYKQELAKETAKDLSTIISRGNIQEITIHQGNEEYLSLLTGIIKSLPKGATKYVLGTGGETFMINTMRPIWKKYHQVALEQKIKIQMLAYESQRGSLQNDIKNPPIYSVKYLPNETENPAGLHIYPDIGVVLNIIYSNDVTPVTAIKITNKALTEGYLNLFKNLWKSAEL